ncbi:MAG: DUF5985 family protein [Candidatus Binatia bacterium]
MSQILLGAIGMASLTAALLFVRFWRTTRDRFFLFFAASFFIEGFNRFLLGLYGSPSEDTPLFYLIRLCAFLLIAAAIIDKNRSRDRGGTPRAG